MMNVGLCEILFLIQNDEREEGEIVCIKGEMSCGISEILWSLDDMNDYDWGK